MTTETTQDSGAATSQAGEQQAADAGAKPAEAAGAQGTQTTTPEAPAAEIVYEFTAPEGVTLDQARVDKFTAVAKELKLPADKAQALVDLATEVEIERAAAFEAQKAQWADEISADKDLGGDKLKETLATAQKAFSLLPAAEVDSFKQLLNQTGYGNHPAMVKWMHAVGKALSEDNFVTGGKAPAGSDQSTAQRMYPNMNP